MHEDTSDLAAIQKRLAAGQFAEALRALERYRSAHPADPDALYMSAVCARYLRRFEDALEHLDQLKRLRPEHGRAYQETGHLLRAMGRDDQALFHYGHATRLNPALEASWQAQLELLLAGDRHGEASMVREQLSYLRETPAPLVAVMDLIAEGRLGRAEELCRQYLAHVPHHPEAMRLLAQIGQRMGVLEDAEFLLESAALLAPDSVRIRIDYIEILRKRQKFTRALAEARTLRDLDPEDVRFKSIHAVECMQTGDFASALALFDEILARVPGDPVTLTSRGHALKTLGRFPEAVASYREALARHPGHGEAYYSLANLKTYTFSDDEIASMHAQERGMHLAHMDHVYLEFALGKGYEDLGDHARSFEYYASGNGRKKAQSRYDAERMTEELRAQQTTCTRALFEARENRGSPAADPIFIVGLPRAGSTLVEQILASHSQVDGTLELPNILSLSQRLRRHSRNGAEPGYPEVLAELDPDELRRFGEEYIEDTRIHRAGAPRFIDKMPNNFRHIGLIRLILPNARIIDARRHPMGCCFSCFKQLFAEGQEFTYSLADLGQYYRDYVELMAHWDAVLPGAVLCVNYEDVVADLEGQVRRMLDFLELPFEQGCLRYYETDRSVRTPSSEQVRRPIYESGIDQWRNFEPWLEPLRDALGPDFADVPESRAAVGDPR